MINIAGRLFVTIKVDGKPLPHSPNLVERITMTEGSGALSPAIELILNDYGGALTRELALTDGNELLVTVGKTPNDIKTQTRQYRVFGIRQLPTPSGPRMQVIGVYDAPGFLTGSVRESFKSTTSDMMQQIASRCKLDYFGPEKFNGRKTDDNQVWINVAKSRAMFVQQTTRHAYMDQHSAMCAILTSLGELRYLNLNDVIETPQDKIKRMFVHNAYEDAEKKDIVTYPVAQARTRSSAGLMNTWQNYGSTRIEHKLEGEQASHDKVEVKTSGNYLAINDTVKKTVERSRIEYSPLDCGNTHANFTKAVHQNMKLLALFTEHVSILTFEVTDLQPLDVVIYRQADHDPKIPVSNSDIYMVIGKTIVVRSGHYAERLELVRHNITEKGAAELATSSTAVQESTIPNSVIDPTSKIGANTLPNAQSLSTMTNPANAAMKEARGSLPDLRNAAGFAVPSLKNVSSEVKAVQSGKRPANQLVSNIRGSIKSLRHYSKMGKNFAGQLKTAAAQMKNLKTQMSGKNLSTVVRSTMLTQKNGIITNFAATLGGTKQMMQMASAVHAIDKQLSKNRSAIEKIPGGREAMQEFRQESRIITSNANTGRRQSVNIWNESVSAMNGITMPAQNVINGHNTQKLTETMSTMYRAPASGSSITIPVSTSASDITSTMLSKNIDRQPNFIPEDAAFDYDTSVIQRREAYNSAHASELPKVSFEDSLWSKSNYADDGETMIERSETSYTTYTQSTDAADYAIADLEDEFEKAESREGDDDRDW